MAAPRKDPRGVQGAARPHGHDEGAEAPREPGAAVGVREEAAGVALVLERVLEANVTAPRVFCEAAGGTALVDHACDAAAGAASDPLGAVVVARLAAHVHLAVERPAAVAHLSARDAPPAGGQQRRHPAR